MLISLIAAVAKNRVNKMGEIIKHIFNIGSPDIDAIINKKLPILIYVLGIGL